MRFCHSAIGTLVDNRGQAESRRSSVAIARRCDENRTNVRQLPVAGAFAPLPDRLLLADRKETVRFRLLIVCLVAAPLIALGATI
jgi:hypothetical protein